MGRWWGGCRCFTSAHDLHDWIFVRATRLVQCKQCLRESFIRRIIDIYRRLLTIRNGMLEAQWLFLRWLCFSLLKRNC